MVIDRLGETYREEEVVKPSRWNAENGDQIVKEALPQRESMGQIARQASGVRGADRSVAG
jgi:hypothetical protein